MDKPTSNIKQRVPERAVRNVPERATMPMTPAEAYARQNMGAIARALATAQIEQQDRIAKAGK